MCRIHVHCTCGKLVGYLGYNMVCLQCKYTMMMLIMLFTYNNTVSKDVHKLELILICHLIKLVSSVETSSLDRFIVYYALCTRKLCGLGKVSVILGGYCMHSIEIVIK